MSRMSNKHLNLEERQRIEKALANGASRAAIAETLGKHKSTIAKEVKAHRIPATHSYGRKKGAVYDCVKMNDCGLKICLQPCEHYQPIRCVRRDRTVGVCNGCPNSASCKLSKVLYRAEDAQKAYAETLSDARQGVNLTSSQAKQLGDFLKPLITRGQSLYVIVRNHPELNLCEKTLYNYLTQGVFSQSGLYDIDLRLKTSRKRPKKNVVAKPRENRAYLRNRTYSDFERSVQDHPGAMIVEMDTVYNDVREGPFIQTFQLVAYNLMVGILHEQLTADAMVHGLFRFKERCGALFAKLCPILLADRGTEFSAADRLEETGCRVFYCDAMAAWQKPHVENNHRLLRMILPKHCDLRALGLRTQDDLDLGFSHINSYPREELQGKTPLDVFMFFYPNQTGLLDRLHLKKIDPDEVILHQNLFKPNQ